MKFKKMNKAFEVSTSKGTLTIENTEYFQIEGNGNAPVVINKEGIQKIEDFFGAEHLEPVINQVWNGGSNFNIIVTTGLKFEGQIYYGIGSGNNLNLTNAIAQAYPAEMAVKRAKAVAALELLRRNYTGTDRLPLLYSSFDEFNTEESVNSKVEIVEDKTEKVTPMKKEVKAPVESKVEETAPVMTEEVSKKTPQKEESVQTEEVTAVGDFVLVTSKYRNGITIKELHESNSSYFSWLATATTLNGKYVEYQEKVKEYIQENNIQIA